MWRFFTGADVLNPKGAGSLENSPSVMRWAICIHVGFVAALVWNQAKRVPDTLHVLAEVLGGQVSHGASTVMDLNHRRGAERHQHHLGAACEECFHHCGSGKKEVGKGARRATLRLKRRRWLQ